MITNYTQFMVHGVLLLAAPVTLALVLWQYSIPAAARGGVAVPAATKTLAGANTPHTAVLAGGCFWGMEEVFQHVKGVTRVVAGYADSAQAHANYRDSSSGRYSDVEAVRITYDPQQISYADLLRIYFSVAHNPTEVDRQGPDTGTQYRSEIFAANAAQARVARAYIHQIDVAGVFDEPIATQVALQKSLATQHKSFHPAEAYHQNYAERHPDSLYIRINDDPKVAALKTRFAQRYRAQPVNLAKNRVDSNPRPE